MLPPSGKVVRTVFQDRYTVINTYADDLIVISHELRPIKQLNLAQAILKHPQEFLTGEVRRAAITQVVNRNLPQYASPSGISPEVAYKPCVGINMRLSTGDINVSYRIDVPTGDRMAKSGSLSQSPLLPTMSSQQIAEFRNSVRTAMTQDAPADGSFGYRMVAMKPAFGENEARQLALVSDQFSEVVKAMEDDMQPNIQSFQREIERSFSRYIDTPVGKGLSPAQQNRMVEELLHSGNSKLRTREAVMAFLQAATVQGYSPVLRVEVGLGPGPDQLSVPIYPTRPI